MITLKNRFLTVEIATKGAELQSVRDADGAERLWQGDAKYWTGRAPIMFPVCGGLKDDLYRLDGQEYTMPKHGYVRQLEWEVESAEAEKAVFLMKEKHDGFPFDYELRMCYELADNSIRISASVKNLDSRTFVYGIGSHEAYATPGGLEACTVVFEKKEDLKDHVLHGNLIERGAVILGKDTDRLPMKTEYFAVDALVFPEQESRSVTLENSFSGKKIRVDYQGLDVLMLWTKPGAGYLCIEPWSNAPDYLDADQDIRHKPGMITLEPGQEATRTHTITVM